MKSEISDQGMDNFFKHEYNELNYLLSLINKSIFLIDEIDYYHSFLEGSSLNKIQIAEIMLTNYYKYNASLEDVKQLEWIHDQLKDSTFHLNRVKSEVL